MTLPDPVTGERCGAKTRRGTQCGRPAGWGTSHVGVGHCKLHGGASPNGEIHAARKLGQIMGEALDVAPHEALLQCVRITAGEVAYMTARVSELQSATVATMFGPRLDIWIAERQKAVERLAKFSKMALDAGVAERQVELAERYGQMIATLIEGILGDLRLTDAQQRRAPTVVRKHLVLIEGQAA